MTNKEEAKVMMVAAEILRSVAHPIRIEIIHHLKTKKKVSVNQLKDHLGISQSMTSQHLAILKRVGLVDCQKEANICHYYIQNKNVFDMLSCVERSARNLIS